MSQTSVSKSAVIDSPPPEAMRESVSTTTPVNPPEVPARRSSPLGKFIFALFLIAGIAWAIPYGYRLFTHVVTDDAYITGYVHLVNTHIAGTVTEVLVDENTMVKEGDVLFQLDPRDSDARVKQTEAQVAEADAQIAFANAQATDAQAKVDQAKAQLTKAQFDFERVKELARTNVSSKQEFDAAKASLDSATAGVSSAEASVQAMISNRHVAEAKRVNSQAMLNNARLQLSYNTITAPATGLTSRRSAEVGAYVQPGQALIAVVEPEVWIEANFKETQLAKMHAGQTAEITIDAVSGHEFIGTVESFSPATGAQFAMLPPDNATGNFTKVVQRVPVRIRFDAESIRGFEDRLRPGQSAVVAVRLK